MVIITCCGKLGSSAIALAEAQEAIGEAFQVLYDGGFLRDADLAKVAKLGQKSAAMALRLDALRWEGLNLLEEISERTKGYNDPKKGDVDD